MRVLIQRVSHAKVTVGGVETGAIQRGLVVFLGVGKGDVTGDADYLVRKILGLRIFPDERGKMGCNLSQAEGSLLVVSQFTLYADTSKGNRPGFDYAAPAIVARELYEYFVEKARKIGFRVETGLFQEHMEVTLVNDGPITIWIDTIDKLIDRADINN